MHWSPPSQPALATLVRPTRVSSSGNWTDPITPPLGLAYLAAMLREAGIEVRAIDGLGEAMDQVRQADGYNFQGLSIEQTVDRIDPDTTVIGVSAMFTQNWLWIARLIAAIRERFPQVLIVVGGEHITALPEESMRQCPAIDVCVLGEGEETFVELIEALHAGRPLEEVDGVAFLRRGELVRTEARKRIRAVDQIPRPAWDLFPMEVYLESRNAHGVYRGRSMGILATRGCPYQCTFCSNPTMYGVLWVARSPEDVLDEIEDYIETYRVQNIDFYDLTMVLKRSWVLDFCRLIEERGLEFTWQLPTGTRSEVLDDEVAAALYRTGCRNVTLAPESGSKDSLEKILKRVKLPKVVEAVRAGLRHGIHIKCNMVIGFPHETRRHMWDTWRFCSRLALLGVTDLPVFLFSPYPGSRLYEELRREGLIGGLDEAYVRSLVSLMNPFAPSGYCREIGPRELLAWRWIIMGSFYALSFLLRPWRFLRLVSNLARNRGETVLEQRLGSLIRRPTPERIRAAIMPPAPQRAAPESRGGV